MRRASRPTIDVEKLERRDCPAGMFSLAQPATPIVEGDLAVFTVRLSQASSVPERVAVSAVSGSATLGKDFMLSNPTQLLFTPGQTSKTFSIRTFTDRVAEGAETFTIDVVPLNRPASERFTVPATIHDIVSSALSVQDIRFIEGDSATGKATFTVALSGKRTLPVTVRYDTQDGTASAGVDYTAVGGSLTFLPTEFVKTVTVPIAGDRVAETSETFKLLLSNPSRGTTIRTPQATCTIANDDRGTPGFQITLTYANPALPDAQKQVFERAVTRIQQIVVGDLPGVTTAGGAFVDDMRIVATVETMDPSLNGYATATAWRAGPGGLPYAGEIHLNAARIGHPGIYYTAIHEILHAMGFLEDFFTKTSTATGFGTSNPLFIGANAVREYNSYLGLGSSPGVPLYGVIAAAGSYGSHWDTATVGTEIMSVGWDTTSTAIRPFSRITIGALDDIGYEVNYTAADIYTKPTDISAASWAAAAGSAVVPSDSSRIIPSVPTAMMPAAVPLRPVNHMLPLAPGVTSVASGVKKADGVWRVMDAASMSVPSRVKGFAELLSASGVPKRLPLFVSAKSPSRHST